MYYNGRDLRKQCVQRAVKLYSIKIVLLIYIKLVTTGKHLEALLGVYLEKIGQQKMIIE